MPKSKTTQDIEDDIREVLSASAGTSGTPRPRPSPSRSSRSSRATRHVDLLIGLMVRTDVFAPAGWPATDESFVRARARGIRMPAIELPEGELRIMVQGAIRPPRGLLPRRARADRWLLRLGAWTDTAGPPRLLVKEARRALSRDGEWRESLARQGVLVERVERVDAVVT